MLRIREGLRPSSSSPCKDLSALDPTNICASRNNLQDVVNRDKKRVDIIADTAPLNEKFAFRSIKKYLSLLHPPL